MFNLEGISNIRKVQWQDLEPGMVLLGGVTINGVVPHEFRDFPVLTTGFLMNVMEQYRFLENRFVLVADTTEGANLRRLSQEIQSARDRVDTTNRFREHFFEDRMRILGADEPDDVSALESEFVESAYLIKDVYSSFTLPFKRLPDNFPLPSFFHQPRLKLTLGDALTGNIVTKFNLPDDKPVTLHLVVDYSRSMDNKLDATIAALSAFFHYVTECLLNVKVNLYIFSDECRQATFPLSGKEMPRRDTYYATFLKKVLHFKEKGRHNKVILFTDGLPSDRQEALRLSELLPKNSIDYTQIVFSFADQYDTVYEGEGADVVDGKVFLAAGERDDSVRETTEEERVEMRNSDLKTYTSVANATHGNQIILNVDTVAKLVAVECFDRYLGLLTLATSKDVHRFRKKDAPASLSENAATPSEGEDANEGDTPSSEGQGGKKKKKVKTFTFKRIERKDIIGKE